MGTSIPFPGFSSPAAGPEAPLDMLGACHARVEKQCRTLERLTPHLVQHGSDAAAREAAQAVLRYFDTAAVHHHADEEEDLFVALHESMAGSDARCIREMTELLCEEHRQLGRRWQTLRPMLSAIAEGQAVTLDEVLVQDFAGGYRRHIAREDRELIPMARRLLDGAQLAAIGQRMARRRGLA